MIIPNRCSYIKSRQVVNRNKKKKKKQDLALFLFKDDNMQHCFIYYFIMKFKLLGKRRHPQKWQWFSLGPLFLIVDFSNHQKRMFSTNTLNSMMWKPHLSWELIALHKFLPGNQFEDEVSTSIKMQSNEISPTKLWEREKWREGRKEKREEEDRERKERKGLWQGEGKETYIWL